MVAPSDFVDGNYVIEIFSGGHVYEQVLNFWHADALEDDIGVASDDGNGWIGGFLTDDGFDIVDDLNLAFATDVGAGENKCDVTVAASIHKFLHDEVLNRIVQLVHELRTC